MGQRGNLRALAEYVNSGSGLLVNFTKVILRGCN